MKRLVYRPQLALRAQQGQIVGVGPGGRDESGKLVPIDLKVGDQVQFGKWSGSEVKIDGVELLIMKESWTRRRLRRKPPDAP